MTLVNLREILVEARKKRYGVPSLLAGNLEMVIGQIMAAEAQRAPPILAFSQIDYFYTETKKLLDILGCSGAIR